MDSHIFRLSVRDAPPRDNVAKRKCGAIHSRYYVTSRRTMANIGIILDYQEKVIILAAETIMPTRVA